MDLHPPWSPTVRTRPADAWERGPRVRSGPPEIEGGRYETFAAPIP